MLQVGVLTYILICMKVRFMEICAQHRDTRKVMLDGDAVASLMEFLHTHTKQNVSTVGLFSTTTC